jgi:threonine aldolase
MACDRALQFERELGAIRGFQILNEVVFNQVLVACDDDEITQNTLKKIQDLRECWVGGSAWEGKRAIRISVCSWATTPDDIARSAKSFERALSVTLEANLAISN